MIGTTINMQKKCHLSETYNTNRPKQRYNLPWQEKEVLFTSFPILIVAEPNKGCLDCSNKWLFLLHVLRFMSG